MSNRNHDPLPPLSANIVALLRQEQDAYPEDSSRRDVVFGRVEMILALAGPAVGSGALAASSVAHATGRGAAAVKAALMGKLVAVGVTAFVAGGVTGGAVVYEASRREAKVRTESTGPVGLPIEARVNPPPAVSAAMAPTISPAPTVSASASPPAGNERAPAASGSAVLSPDRGATARDLTRERELIDVARAALGRRQPGDAIVAAEEHANRWPHGYLAEEREVVLIEALAASGRRVEADQRAARFRKSYPKSMLLSAVDGVVGEVGRPGL